MGVRIPPPLPEIEALSKERGKCSTERKVSVPGSKEVFMATQAGKVKNEESRVSRAAAGVGQKVFGKVADTREFLYDVRGEMKQGTWPSRDDVMSTTTVAIATVFFF